MRDLRRGDRVWTGSAFVAVRMVQMSPTSGATFMVRVTDGLLMTLTHPVQMPDTSTWVHPVSVAHATLVETDAVYNLLLEACDTPWVEVNGVRCITLGHNIRGDSIAEHPFFGNRAAVEDAYSKLPGWEEGRVTVRCEQFIRDPTTGYVCGILLA